MTTIVTRAGKGAPLTNAEMDANFTNLNDNKLEGIVPATKGGTGQTSYAVGDLLYASTTTALSKLAGVATGNVLISGGAGVAPSWGKVGLTTHVSGTLAIANGGTNSTATPTNGGVSYGAGTAYAFTAAGTAKQVLISNGAAAPTWATLDLTYLPDAAFKKSVRAATTANITLSGTQTIDGIAVVAGDRVLVKNQTTASQNGIYTVSTGAWARVDGGNTASEIAGAVVNVDSGTQGGQLWTTSFKTTDTLGTTAMNWSVLLDSSNCTSYAPKLDGTGATGTWGIAITGNAATATKLATARTINGVSFDGSANITIADGTKEPAIVPGTTAQYWSGNKTWQDFATAVRAAVLTGLSTATSTAVAAADTVLAAIGKLQAQITLKAPLASPALTGDPTAPTPAQFDDDTSLATTAYCKRMGIEAADIVIVNATSTLTAAAFGTTQVLAPSSPITITLPSASAGAKGARIEFINTGTATATVVRAGTDAVSVNGGAQVTSISVAPGDTLTLETNDVSLWFAVAGSAQLGFASVFAASKASNGYQKLPSGLIIQWGLVTYGAVAAGGYYQTTVNYPTAFPTGCISMSMLPQTNEPNTISNAWAPINTGSFYMFLHTTQSYSSVPVNWIAIGY